MKHIKTFVALAFLPLILGACSVKEDRVGCPCTLNVDLDGFALMGSCREVLVQVQGKQLLQRTVNPQDYIGHGYDIEVKRCANRVSVVSGMKSSVVVGDTLSVADGVEADPLYLFSSTVLCEDDLAFVEAVPYKKWCDVHIILENYVPGEEFPYDVVLSSDCRSVRLSTGEALPGDYRILVTRTKGGEPVVRLPRQKESVAALEFFDRNETRDYSHEKPVFRTDIGLLMDRQGYDWSKDNLDDVYVFVNHARMTATIKLVEWEKETLIEEI